ncbi:MAG: hypothetical protein LBF55_06960, partial [Prevotellaceae bacterium]|nr:hypothetical protein [Prevotellaceae bacterium]
PDHDTVPLFTYQVFAESGGKQIIIAPVSKSPNNTFFVFIRFDSILIDFKLKKPFLIYVYARHSHNIWIF